MNDANQTWSVLTLASWVIQYLTPFGLEVAKLSLIGTLYFVVERWRAAHPEQRFFKSDFRTELAYPLFNVLVTTPLLTLLMAALILPLLQAVAPYHLLATFADTLPFVGQMVLALLLIDVAVYVEHRFISHGFMWEFHALHHMTPEVSWLTWARVHPINGITIALTATLLHYVFGFGGAAVGVASAIAGSLSIWEHSNMAFAWPKPLCYLLVSPRFHRWHHGREAEAVDKNFCLVLPFLDVLGGTYYCPDRLPHAYGLYVDPGAAPEEKQAAAIPADFRGQMLYPFQRKLGKLRSLMRPPAQPLPVSDPNRCETAQT